jgi:hypothetical protein
MIHSVARGIGQASHNSYLIVSKARHGCKAMIQVHVVIQ